MIARAPRCGGCRYFIDDAATIERELVGLTILGSAQGETWGDQGICRFHQQMALPRMRCDDWAPRDVSAAAAAE